MITVSGEVLLKNALYRKRNKLDIPLDIGCRWGWHCSLIGWDA